MIYSDTDIDRLAKRTLQKFESRRFVGNGRYIHDNRRINMHVLLHILAY